MMSATKQPSNTHWFVSISHAWISVYSGPLLAMAAVLATATRWRWAMGIGPGELLIAIWAILHGVGISVARQTIGLVVRKGMLLCIAAFALSMATGALMTSQREGALRIGALHDAIALAGIALIVAMTTAIPWRHPFWGRLAWGYLASWASAFVVLFGLDVAGSSLVAQSAQRLHGWSLNPNQLALGIVALPGIATYVAVAQQSWRSRTAAGATAGLGIAAGLLTRSDALMLAWILGSALAFAFAAVHFARNRLANRRQFLSVVIGAAGALAIMGGAATRWALSRWEWHPPVEQSLPQGPVRLELWRRAIEHWTVSPLVGSGPGVTSSLGQGPPVSEAHNTYLDVLGMSGALGLCVLIAATAWIMVRAWQARGLLIGTAVALAAFAGLHLVLRHPVYMVQVLIVAGFTQRMPQDELKAS